MRLTLCGAPTHETRPDHNTGNFVPYSLREVREFFNVPAKMQETGPTVYRPYPRRLERLTICICHYKGKHILVSHFKTLSVGPVRLGLEPETSHTAVRRSTN